jgi:hypothetical protein
MLMEIIAYCFKFGMAVGLVSLGLIGVFYLYVFTLEIGIKICMIIFEVVFNVMNFIVTRLVDK